MALLFEWTEKTVENTGADLSNIWIGDGVENIFVSGSESADWLHLDGYSAENQVFGIIVDANITGEGRVGSIFLEFRDRWSTTIDVYEFKITQGSIPVPPEPQNEYLRFISESTTTVNASSHTLSFNVEFANLLSTPAVLINTTNMISNVRVEGLSQTILKITYDVNENASTGSRIGTMYVTGTGVSGQMYSLTYTVNQDGSRIDKSLEFVPNTLPVASKDGESFDIQLHFTNRGDENVVFDYNEADRYDYVEFGYGEWDGDYLPIRITFKPNVLSIPREGQYLTATAVDSGINTIITFKQEASEGQYLGLTEIWRDFYIDLGDSDSEVYDINIDNQYVYTGKAYRIGTDTIRINPNRIVEDYLESNFNNRERIQTNPNVVRTVTVISRERSFYYKVVDNWSYDPIYRLTDNSILSKPVKNYVDYRMLAPITRYSEENGVVTDWQTYDRLTPKNLCNCRYGLYYYNLYGGWDSLPVEGKTIEKVNVSREMMGRHKDTTYINKMSIGMHSCIPYSINTKQSWVLTTGFLSEDECKLMPNLFLSNNVYLHDLDNDVIYPVNITDTTCEIKNNRYSGHRKCYTINIERSTDMKRK